ncbi:HAAS signaling domain-containing protein [Geodermatophilus sp. DSM 44513]|uniref:HAAS signaling domain-containing protein n=1 Tax=Geodermatophilus sp. DSM 44513 TaxID=1528104 RepID=UPI0012753604|nr:hypothetical protein [Geodermatophilus sp. DSM 44513]WNV76438.1 hypothetical protein RTG05_04010 [Geodermatophilus sp. DSM 44513]
MSSPTDSGVLAGARARAEARTYAQAVRAELAALSPDRVAELLDDLEDHLAEVAAEDGRSLEARLGSPADYARELCAAAGLTVGPPARPARGAALVDRLGRARAWPGVHEALRFLPELRPAWWVVRAWAAVTVVDVVFVGGTSFPLPTLGLGPVGWVVTALAVAWSVRLGLRSRAAGREPDRRVLLLNAGLGLLTAVAVVAVADGPEVASAEPVYVEQFGTGGLTHGDGTPITDIRPYSSDGEPLSGVLLYDQDGRPVDDLSTHDAEGAEVPPAPGPPRPANAYPQRQVVAPATTPVPTPAAPTPGPSEPPAPGTP